MIKIVSVPSRGILFPNTLSFPKASTQRVSVPSRGILFPNGLLPDMINQLMLLFPSPLGASYFQIFSVLISTQNFSFSVSVPSRGILFPNRLVQRAFIVCMRVSVPSRGILFPNVKTLEDGDVLNVFPSPLGASYFQIVSRTGLGESQKSVSVPSRGILFPNDTTQERN